MRLLQFQVILRGLFGSVCRIPTLIFGRPLAPPPPSCPQTERSPCSKIVEQPNASEVCSMPSTMPSESEIAPSELLLLRFIRNKNHWKRWDPTSTADVEDASKDFALRPDEEFLSFFQATNVAEGRPIAAAFKVTGPGRPDTVDYILFPRSLFIESGLQLSHKPDNTMPEYLSSRHWGTVGPRHEPDKELIRRLLAMDEKTTVRLSKRETVEIARELIRDETGFSDHLGDYWGPNLLGS
jgi:hypothetical protein